jgi:PAS domain S-box-containing protein
VVDFKWVYENAAIARMNGTNPETIVGRRLLELFPGYSRSPFFAAYKQVAETGVTSILEASYQDESIPKPTWFRVVLVSMGKDIAVLAQDITERKLVEQKLCESEFHLARSQQIARLGSWSWDIANDSIYWSDEIYRLFGLQPGEFVPRYEDLLRFVHPEDRDRVDKAVWDALVHGHFHPEYRIIQKAGEERYLHSDGEITFDKNGEPVKLEGYVQDITERKELEARQEADPHQNA